MLSLFTLYLLICTLSKWSGILSPLVGILQPPDVQRHRVQDGCLKCSICCDAFWSLQVCLSYHLGYLSAVHAVSRPKTGFYTAVSTTSTPANNTENKHKQISICYYKMITTKYFSLNKQDNTEECLLWHCIATGIATGVLNNSYL